MPDTDSTAVVLPVSDQATFLYRYKVFLSNGICYCSGLSTHVPAADLCSSIPSSVPSLLPLLVLRKKQAAALLEFCSRKKSKAERSPSVRTLNKVQYHGTILHEYGITTV
jgi:hypothetical protein